MPSKEYGSTNTVYIPEMENVEKTEMIAWRTNPKGRLRGGYKEWVRNFFDFKLLTVWFYGGLNNGENTNNNQWQKSHSTVYASRPST